MDGHVTTRARCLVQVAVNSVPVQVLSRVVEQTPNGRSRELGVAKLHPKPNFSASPSNCRSCASISAAILCNRAPRSTFTPLRQTAPRSLFKRPVEQPPPDPHCARVRRVVIEPPDALVMQRPLVQSEASPLSRPSALAAPPENLDGRFAVLQPAGNPHTEEETDLWLAHRVHEPCTPAGRLRIARSHLRT